MWEVPVSRGVARATTTLSPLTTYHSVHRLPEYAIPVSVSTLSHATRTCSWRPAKERAYMGTSFSSSLSPAASLQVGNGSTARDQSRGLDLAI